MNLLPILLGGMFLLVAGCWQTEVSLPKLTSEWQTVFEEDLTRVKLIRDKATGAHYSDNWIVKKGSWKSTERGLLKDRNNSEGVLYCRLPLLSGAFRVEYEAMSGTPGDMSLVLGSDPQDNQYSSDAVFVGFAMNANKRHVIQKPSAKPVETTEGLAVPGQWHVVTVTRTAGKITFAVDGAELLTTPDIRSGMAAPYLAFYGWHSGTFRKVTVQKKMDPLLAEYLAPSAVEAEKYFSKEPLQMAEVQTEPDRKRNWGLYERSEIFAAIDSFDHKGLSDAEFEQQALKLVKGGHASAAALHASFLKQNPAVEKPLALRYDTTYVDRLMDGYFSFYDEEHFLGQDFSWDENPGTDHWGHDLNRFNYIPQLINAGKQTGKEKYLQKAAGLILDWVEKNEVCDAPEWGGDRDRSRYVWSSYLNIAIHLRTWARYMKDLAPYMAPSEFLQVLKSMHDQMRWLEKVIPLASNNWVLIGSGCLLGLVTDMPDFRDAERIRDYAWQHFVDEADIQILEDGAQFELTQHYHNVVLGLYLRAQKDHIAGGGTVSEDMLQKTRGMIDYAMHNVTPDGLCVSFNDSDAETGASVKRMLAEEGRLQKRDDWLYVGTDGNEGTVPSVTSTAFTRAGVYIMRTGWDAEDTMLAFDGGPWGRSHQHSDKLGFWLTAYGRSLLIDPGRYLYDKNNPYTPYLKSSKAHNTVTVDGKGQADKYFPNTWVPGPELVDNTWENKGDFQRAVSSHKLGYGKDGNIEVIHTRAILFWQPDMILVVDDLTGEGEHEFASRLHCAPGTLVESNGIWYTGFGDGDIAILPWMSAKHAVTVTAGQTEPEVMGWYSKGFSKIEASPTMTVTAEAVLPLNGLYLIAPFKRGARPKPALNISGDQIKATVGSTVKCLTFADALE